jgi:hypothetical protein
MDRHSLDGGELRADGRENSLALGKGSDVGREESRIKINAETKICP